MAPVAREPFVSVIVPSYNGGKFIEEAVTSVLAQTYQHLELIVVDDGSTDDTREVLAPYMNRLTYVFQSNQGLSAARNAGIARASGELLAFLDSDDVWRPAKIERQVALLLARPGVGLVHTNKVDLDGTTGLLTERPAAAYEWVRTMEGDCYRRLFLANNMVVSSVLVRRELLHAVGTFDDRITKPSTQDYDLWLRLSRRTHFAFVDEPLVLYRQHNANASKQLKMMLTDELYVVEKAIAADPGLAPAIGANVVRERLAALWSGIAWANYEAGDFAAANRCFAKVLRYRQDGGTLLRWAATLLPPFLVNAIRHGKQWVAIQAG